MKGAFSDILGEWVRHGVLYHIDKINESVTDAALIKGWKESRLELLKNMLMVIADSDEIGAACARIMK